VRPPVPGRRYWLPLVAFLAACGCRPQAAAAPGVPPALAAGGTPAREAVEARDEPDETATFDARFLGGRGWKRGRLGLRAAYLLPLFQEEAFLGTFAAGLFYQELGLRQRNIVYELGFDYGRVSSRSGYVHSDLFMVRGELMLAPWARIGSRGSHYWVLGFHGMTEVARDEVASETYYVYEVGPTVGWGFTHARRGWDARVTAAILTGSGNAGVLLFLAGSYAF